MTNYFEELNRIDCKDKIEKKNGLSYLSWAFAWGELKKKHPTASYTIYENQQGWNYHTDGRTAWVKTGVSIDGLEHIEYLPVMDYRNKSIPLDSITSFDVNKTIQRSLTKAVARHGLGLYIYAGEDLPEDDSAADAFKKDVSNEKRKETIANKKAAEAYKSTPEGLKERHATCIAYLAKLSEIANKEAKSYQMANSLASDLFAAGMEKEAAEIAAILDKKLFKIDDELPDFSEGSTLSAG